MSTSLSRHLFRLDEVAAALRYAIVERRIEEGMFWTLELIDSEEVPLLIETLLDVWVFAIGTARLAVLPMLLKIAQTMNASCDGTSADTSAGSSLTAEFLLEFVYKILRLPKSCRDGSLLSIATLAREDLQQGGLDVKMEEMSMDPSGVYENCKSALRRGDARAATRWIWRMPAVAKAAIRDSVIAERRTLQAACRSAAATTANFSYRFAAPIWGPLWNILEVLVLSMPADAYAESAQPLLGSPSMELQAEIRGWQAAVGRRRRRCFAVPALALKWITARGRSTYTPTNFKELREPWHHMGGCAYWRRKAGEFGCEVVGNAIRAVEDDVWEGFCEFAFPDDIPDEWSAADQALSHGEGMIAPGFTPSFSNWFRAWFPETSVAGPANSKILLNRIIESKMVPLECIWMDCWLASTS